MKERLQQRLQSQVGMALPGYTVWCEYSSGRVIDIYLHNSRTHEAMRITGVTLNSLIGPGVLEDTVDQLMFEILVVADRQRPPSDSRG